MLNTVISRRLFCFVLLIILSLVECAYQLSPVSQPASTPVGSPVGSPTLITSPSAICTPTLLTPTVETPFAAPATLEPIIESPVTSPTAKTPTVFSPTYTPTVAPTETPTFAPTYLYEPTESPTLDPPTLYPTLDPTTHSPTLDPTFMPTVAPSAPTSAPTKGTFGPGDFITGTWSLVEVVLAAASLLLVTCVLLGLLLHWLWTVCRSGSAASSSLRATHLQKEFMSERTPLVRARRFPDYYPDSIKK